MIHHPSNISAPKTCQYFREAAKKRILTFDTDIFWENFNADIEAYASAGRKGWDAVLTDPSETSSVPKTIGRYDEIKLVGDMVNNHVSVQMLLTYHRDVAGEVDHHLRLQVEFDTDGDQIRAVGSLETW